MKHLLWSLLLIPSVATAEPRAILCKGSIRITITDTNGKVEDNSGKHEDTIYILDDSDQSFRWFVPERTEEGVTSKEQIWDVCFGYTQCSKRWDKNSIFIEMRGGDDAKKEWLSLDRVTGKLEGARDWHNEDPPGMPSEIASPPSDTHQSFDFVCEPTSMPKLKTYTTKF